VSVDRDRLARCAELVLRQLREKGPSGRAREGLQPRRVRIGVPPGEVFRSVGSAETRPFLRLPEVCVGSLSPRGRSLRFTGRGTSSPAPSPDSARASAAATVRDSIRNGRFWASAEHLAHWASIGRARGVALSSIFAVGVRRNREQYLQSKAYPLIPSSGRVRRTSFADAPQRGQL
jgi:hypothetical protein